MSDFNKTVEGTTLRFAPQCAITASNALQLKDEINESLEGMTEVVFDCTDLEYISSSGLRVLLATQKALAGTGTVRVINAAPDVKEVLEVTRLSAFISVED